MSHNEVKIPVRKYALELQEFTVAQMVQITGLNVASIRTELKRMTKSNYLSTTRSTTSNRVGAPPLIYNLTQDQEKVDELKIQVSNFFRYTENITIAPEGYNYRVAKRLLNELEESPKISKYEKAQALEEIDLYIELSTEDEGVGIKKTPRTEIVGAYLNLLEVRRYIMSGNLQIAEENINAAKFVFEQYDIDVGKQEVTLLNNNLSLHRLYVRNPDSEWEKDVISSIKSMDGIVNASIVFKLIKKLNVFYKEILASSQQPTEKMNKQPFSYDEESQEQGWRSNTFIVRGSGTPTRVPFGSRGVRTPKPIGTVSVQVKHSEGASNYYLHKKVHITGTVRKGRSSDTFQDLRESKSRKIVHVYYFSTKEEGAITKIPKGYKIEVTSRGKPELVKKS